MSWLGELVKGAVAGLVEGLVNRAPKARPWRWGHGFLQGSDNQCLYCYKFIPSRSQVTNPPCVGPDHHLSGKELGR